MNALLTDLQLETLVPTPHEIDRANRQALGEGWELAEQFLRLHAQALQAISRRAGDNPSDRDQCAILLGAHGVNLFLADMRLIVAGQFDVSPYLLRAAFDCQALFYGAVGDEDFAQRFLRDEEELASKARKKLVKDIGSGDTDNEEGLSDFLNDRLVSDAKAANTLSHVGLSHMHKLMVGLSIKPQVGGHCDPDEALKACQAALEQEHWLLSWIGSFYKALLSDDWKSEFKGARRTFISYMNQQAAIHRGE